MTHWTKTHRVVLDPADGACYFTDDNKTRYITGDQIKRRASKFRDPVVLSSSAKCGITEDDKPYLEWTDE